MKITVQYQLIHDPFIIHQYHVIIMLEINAQ